MPFYIFLDVDGVLNSDTTQDFVGCYYGVDDELVKNLKLVVNTLSAKYRDIQIILSSTWAEGWYHEDEKCDALAKRLNEALAACDLKVTDQIYENHKLNFNRGHAILEWLKAHPCEEYIVIDDDRYDFEELPEIHERWLHTNTSLGLTPNALYFVDKLINAQN